MRRPVAGSDLGDRLRARSDEIVQLISEVEGVRAYYLIQAGADSISVTISDHEAGGNRSSEVAAEWLQNNMADAAPPSPTISSGSVTVSL